MSGLPELILGALMIATCGYCVILNRRLAALRDSHRELLRSIDTFDAAARAAETNLKSLQASGARLAAELSRRTSEADAARDELSVMTAAGDRIAGRIENAVDSVKSLHRANRARALKAAS